MELLYWKIKIHEILLQFNDRVLNCLAAFFPILFSDLLLTTHLCMSLHLLPSLLSGKHTDKSATTCPRSNPVSGVAPIDRRVLCNKLIGIKHWNIYPCHTLLSSVM